MPGGRSPTVNISNVRTCTPNARHPLRKPQVRPERRLENPGRQDTSVARSEEGQWGQDAEISVIVYSLRRKSDYLFLARKPLPLVNSDIS